MNTAEVNLLPDKPDLSVVYCMVTRLGQQNGILIHAASGFIALLRRTVSARIDNLSEKQEIFQEVCNLS